MNPELAQLRALAAAITTAEAAVETAYRCLYESAAALLRAGDATLAEISAASGLDQGELLELLSRSTPEGSLPGNGSDVRTGGPPAYVAGMAGRMGPAC